MLCLDFQHYKIYLRVVTYLRILHSLWEFLVWQSGCLECARRKQYKIKVVSSWLDALFCVSERGCGFPACNNSLCTLNVFDVLPCSNVISSAWAMMVWVADKSIEGQLFPVTFNSAVRSPLSNGRSFCYVPLCMSCSGMQLAFFILSNIYVIT